MEIDEEKYFSYFDLPTTVNVIFQNVITSRSDFQERSVLFQSEMNIFKSRLSWLIYSRNQEKYIKLVDIPNFEDIKGQMENMESASSYLTSKCCNGTHPKKGCPKMMPKNLAS